ncbi:MAG: NADH dehydrogenase (quinone) subunit D [bacterium]|nr:NADH dehydrogenase (quinone) subunit D [bacterium]
MTTHKMTLNMGPQHPSTHGVLRLVLELDGETITACEPHIGYLHRGIEKLAESKTYHQFLPITDRLDYIAAPSNNLAYCLAVEKLAGLEVPKRASYIRMIIAELTRIASHLVWLGTHALDIGAYTVFLYTFRERELILDIFESYCGARLTTTCFRIGGVPYTIDDGLKKQIADFIKIFPKKIEEYEGLLTKNPIWLNRTQNIGIIPKDTAISYGLTGPTLRGSGIDRDIRKVNPYSCYDEVEFVVPKGRGIGDVYDRYLVRLDEMRESVKIITQALERLPDGEILADCPKVIPPKKERVKTEIAALIHHFHIMTEGFELPKGEAFLSIEAPKGELGFYIVSDGGNKPARLRIRTPSFANLSCISEIGKGVMIADMVAIIGSLDIVLGEIDR